MMTFNAIYYRADSSRPEETTVSVGEDGYLVISADGSRTAVRELDVRARIANTQRKIILPENRLLETYDNNIVDTIVSQWGLSAEQHGAFRLESSLRFAAISVVGIVAIATLGYLYGLPWASHKITQLIPISIDNMIGKQIFPQIDDAVLSETELSAQRQQELHELFEKLLISSLDGDARLTPLKTGTDTGPATTDNLNDEPPRRVYQLLFRDSILGANAFAIPDATIVVLDDLAQQLNDDEIASIFLHEIAHVKERHTMQLLVRQSGIAAFFFALSGDASYSAGLVTSMPIVLSQMSYSREFETQSDTFALQQMLAMDIPPIAFANAMKKISQQGTEEAHQHQDEDRSLIDFFASHPATSARIARFEEAQRILDESPP